MICKNCNNGFVDGGQRKRINNQVEQLTQRMDMEIAKIKEKNKKKRMKKQNEIKSNYTKLIRIKQDEPKIKIKCGYCKGTGFK